MTKLNHLFLERRSGDEYETRGGILNEMRSQKCRKIVEKEKNVGFTTNLCSAISMITLYPLAHSRKAEIMMGGILDVF